MIEGLSGSTRQLGNDLTLLVKAAKGGMTWSVQAMVFGLPKAWTPKVQSCLSLARWSGRNKAAALGSWGSMGARTAQAWLDGLLFGL